MNICSCGRKISTPQGKRCRRCYLAYRKTPEGVAEFFWAHVDRSGGPDACWPWRGVHLPNGYGRYSAKAFGTGVAHRVAWIITFGPVAKGLDVMHRCDNRTCCNVFKHCLLGTRKHNMQDAVAKGRTSRSFQHPHSKLTPQTAFYLKHLYATGLFTQQSLGRWFEVCGDTVSRLVRGASYRPFQIKAAPQ